MGRVVAIDFWVSLEQRPRRKVAWTDSLAAQHHGEPLHFESVTQGRVADVVGEYPG